MSRSRLTAVAASALLALVLSGCALNPEPVSTANRPDVTAAPPKSYGKPVVKDVDATKAKKKAGKKAGKKAAPKRAAWVPITDAPSGIRFAMPRKVQGVETEDTDGKGRTYNLHDTDRVISVSIGPERSEPSISEIQAYVDQFEQGLAAEVGIRPEVGEHVSGDRAGRPTVSETLTMRPGNGMVSVAGLHVVWTGRVAVVVAVVTNGRDEAAVRERSRRLTGRVLDELRLS